MNCLFHSLYAGSLIKSLSHWKQTFFSCAPLYNLIVAGFRLHFSHLRKKPIYIRNIREQIEVPIYCFMKELCNFRAFIKYSRSLTLFHWLI